MNHKQDAKRLLKAYLSHGSEGWTFENDDEVDWIVDSIIAAAVEETIAEMNKREINMWSKE